jgi:hypothetical protein
MNPPHFLVFIGANPSLSTELLTLEGSFPGMKLVAPAAPKGGFVISELTVGAALDALADSLGRQESHSGAAKLTIWTYKPDNHETFSVLWRSFGRSGWVEFIPSNLIHKFDPLVYTSKTE